MSQTYNRSNFDRLKNMSGGRNLSLSLPDEMVEIWENMFLKIADAHAPMRTRRVRNRKSPWITTELIELITGRNRLKRQAILTKHPSIYIHTSTSNSSISELKSGDNSFTKPAEMCEILNDHFTSVSPNLASKLPSGSTSFDLYINPLSTTFNLQHTSATEVLKLLGTLSPNKATGLDNISCRLLKEAGPIIATSLTCIINKTIDTGLFSSQWKMAKVFPLYEKDDRNEAQKICEKVVYDQQYCCLNSNGLLSKNQSGFRSLHSTVTALLHLTNDWYLNIGKGMTNLIVLLDLAKAFDAVSNSLFY